MPDAWTTIWSDYLSKLQEVIDINSTSPYYRHEVWKGRAFRTAARILGLANLQYVIDADPDAPVFVRADWGYPNPDNIYLSTELEDEGVYRIFGKFGSANQSYISVYRSNIDGTGEVGGRIKAEDFVCDANGEFSLWIAKEKRPEYRNWIANEPGTTSVAIYEIFADWDSETKGWFGIERLDRLPDPQAELSPESLKARLDKAVFSLCSKLKYWQDVANRIYAATPANAAGDPWRHHISSLDTWFCPGHWVLASDQALVIEIDPEPAARYWGFSTYDPSSEPLDYQNRVCSLNMKQAKAGADGVVRLVLAHHDPGYANWIDIGGFEEGIFSLRVTSGEVQPSAPHCRVVSFDELAAALPKDEVVYTDSEREQQIRSRQRHIQYRYSL
jgi:hypothetical protein